MTGIGMKHMSETLKNNRYNPSLYEQRQWNKYSHRSSVSFSVGFRDKIFPSS